MQHTDDCHVSLLQGACTTSHMTSVLSDAQCAHQFYCVAFQIWISTQDMIVINWFASLCFRTYHVHKIIAYAASPSSTAAKEAICSLYALGSS